MVAQLGTEGAIIARAIVLAIFCPLWTPDQLTHQPLLEIELIVHCLQPSLYLRMWTMYCRVDSDNVFIDSNKFAMKSPCRECPSRFRAETGNFSVEAGL